MKNKADYSKYECPYSHLEKEGGHELRGPEGYQDVYSVWCVCGFSAPVFYLDPDELGLKLKKEKSKKRNRAMIDPSAQAKRRIEVLKKERKQYEPYQEEWHELSVAISQINWSIERWERMKKEGIKF